MVRTDLPTRKLPRNGVLGDQSWEVLVLYRERSDEKNFGSSRIVRPERFRIQRLEGSRCGIFQLCILKSGKSRESGRSGECIADGRFHSLSGGVFPAF